MISPTLPVLLFCCFKINSKTVAALLSKTPSLTAIAIPSCDTRIAFRRQVLNQGCVEGSLLSSTFDNKNGKSTGERHNLHARFALQSRRFLLQHCIVSAATAVVSTTLPCGALASETTGLLPGSTTLADEDHSFVRRTKDLSYKITLPPGYTQSNKLLKTHLDEVNFSSPSSNCQYGITVDPVRISSLSQFGSPPQIAAKIVMAELNRDGVTDVTLISDPVENQRGGYEVDYISKGKRGTKRFATRTYITKDQRLYVLTAQCREEAYAAEKEQMEACVNSFTVLR